MKTKYIIAALLLLIQLFIYAEEKPKIKTGVELDALPYITGGYYGSFWLGYDKLRFRAIVTDVNTPDFLVSDGFDDLNTKAYTFIVDYFPYAKKGSYKGFWAGLGVEYWKNSVTNSNSKAIGKYESLILTAGTGYIVNIWNNLYLNPWCAVHAGITGMDEFDIGGRNYSPSKLTPEASLKIGWAF